MSNLSITTKQNNEVRSDVDADKKVPAAEINEMVSWMNQPSKSQGTWDASVDIDMNESGVYSAHTATGDETWNFANLVEGNVKWLPLTTDGTHTFTIGTNGSIYVGSLGQLSSGTYLIGLGVIAGSVRVSVPQSTSQTQLNAPTNFQASASSQQVALSWSAPQGATSYTLGFSTNQTDWTDCTTLGTPYDGVSTSYTHTGLTNDTIYYYRVKAKAAEYTDSAYAQVNATPTTGAIKLTAPTLNTATAGNTQVSLAFTNPNSGNEDDNLVQYSTDNFASNIVNGVIAATSATSVVQTGLVNDTLYYFRIIARGSGSYSNSDASNILSATPESAALTLTSATIDSEQDFVDVVASEGLYGANDGSTPLSLSDFSIIFAANGGTATKWTPLFIKKNDNTTIAGASALTGGESTVRIFGECVGSTDGNETLTVTPTDGSSIYNSAGLAMVAAETVNDNFPVLTLIQQYAFSGNLTDTGGSINLTALGDATPTTDQAGNTAEAYQTSGSGHLLGTGNALFAQTKIKIKCRVFSTFSSVQAFYSIYEDSNNRFAIYSNNLLLQCQVRIGGTDYFITSDTGTDLFTSNEWHDVEWRLDCSGGSQSAFVNGVEITYTTQDTPPANLSNLGSVNTKLMARDVTNVQSMNGKLENLKIFTY